MSGVKLAEFSAAHRNVQMCARCIFDEDTAGIAFDAEGICSYCRMVEGLTEMYGTGTAEGATNFESIVDDIKRAGRGKKYDVAVGVSGGTDSSYMLYLAKEYGLRPLAVHYDNTWNTSIATMNIQRLTATLEVDLYTHVCDNRESDDIFKSFFMAGVPELDGPTDIALAEVMYRAASKYGINYVFEGHSFTSEGVSPMARSYVDGRYISDIHKRFGSMPMKTFPNMPIVRFLYWTIVKRIQKIRPLWYLEYTKEDAKEMLKRDFGWVDYGGHHLENRMTAFQHSFYMPTKFNLDQRNNSLSARVRAGSLTQAEALAIYREPPCLEDNMLEYVLKRFQMSEADFWSKMEEPPRDYTDYKTYKRRFETMRPLFSILADANLVPRSFYLKYCFPVKN